MFSKNLFIRNTHFMKNIFLSLCVITLLISCEDRFFPYEYGIFNNRTRLIDQILIDNNLSKKFVYDTQNRISQIINYHNDTRDTTFITYNRYNLVEEIKYQHIYVAQFTYEDGKLTESVNLNTQNPEWNMKISYYYSGNRISIADKSYNGKLTGKIVFGYDKKGNTISRIEYSLDKSFNMEEYHYSYDDKQNPFVDFPNIPMDVIQSNNAVKSFHYSLVMSSLPTEYGFSYKYDAEGFPITAKKFISDNPTKTLNTYTYIYK